jgi:peptide/nickel transport system substrate-binding protein
MPERDDDRLPIGAGALERVTSRRELFRLALGAGVSSIAAMSLLAACGGDDDDDDDNDDDGGDEPTATSAPSGETAATDTPAPDDEDDEEEPTEAEEPEATQEEEDEEPEPTFTVPPVISSGGHLIVGNEGDPQTLDPVSMVGLPPRRVGRSIYNALVSVDEQGTIHPELIESWEQTDETTYTLHLREGVMFHDDTPFDAEAVKFHFDRHLDPDVASLRAGELSSIDSASIIDAHAVEVKLKQPFAPFLAALFDWSGFVVSPTAVERWGDEYGLHPVGTGPFRFVEYSADQHTIVERNPNYWETDSPLLDNITFRPIPVDSTRLTDLRTEGVHLAENMPLQDVPRLRDDSDIVLSIYDGFRFDYMHFVSTVEPYGTNKLVRQAVNYAIDREELLVGAFFETGAVGYQPFFRGSPFYDPSFAPYTRDLDRARQLLEESGAPSPITWNVPVSSQDQVKLRVAQIVQAQLDEVGITMNLEQLDATAFRDRILARSETFVIGFGWWGYRPDPDQYLSTLMFSESNNNYGDIHDPRIDDLLAQGRSVTDPDERMQIYDQLRNIVSDESIYIYYWEGPNIKGLSPRVRGFTHMPDSIVRYHQISLEE